MVAYEIKKSAHEVVDDLLVANYIENVLIRSELKSVMADAVEEKTQSQI